MLEELFRTNEAAQSTVQGVALSIVASFFLSFLLVATYRLTSREVVERREFMQGMALISIVATMVMQAIGDSLARGLGMLGALSIIRFRTSLTSPRNMSFMFASLAAGIACGVFGFTIALIGTLAFCVVAVALSFEFRGDAGQLTGELRVTLPATGEGRVALLAALGLHTHRLELAERRYGEYTAPAPAAQVLAKAPEPATTGATQVLAKAVEPATAGEQREAYLPSSLLPSDQLPITAPIRTQILTYRFRLKRGADELALLEAIVGLPTLIDHRLRFLRNLEQL